MTDYKPQPKLGDFFKIIIFLITFYYTLEVCPKFSSLVITYYIHILYSKIYIIYIRSYFDPVFSTNTVGYHRSLIQTINWSTFLWLCSIKCFCSIFSFIYKFFAEKNFQSTQNPVHRRFLVHRPPFQVESYPKFSKVNVPRYYFRRKFRVHQTASLLRLALMIYGIRITVYTLLT